MAHPSRAPRRSFLLLGCLGLVGASALPARAAEGAPAAELPQLAPLPTAAPAPAPRGPWAQLRWAQVRANAWLVQNTQGSAYALQLGYTPQLKLRDVPLGLRLLAEFGALRNASKQVFVTPSAQALLTWQPLTHVELGLGAGVQIWCTDGGLVLPVVTAEAHYLPHRRVAKVIHSAFVAASAGASSGAGLQVRLGIALDFQRPAPSPLAARHEDVALAAAAPMHLRPPTPLRWGGHGPACKPCPDCPDCPRVTSATDLPELAEDALLATHLLFAFNAAHLDAESVAYLNDLGAALAAAPTAWATLEVVGHADSVGTAAQNHKVSERRAAAVRGALVEAGVAADRIEAKGVGETQSIVGERPDAAAQRRVTLRLRKLVPSDRLHGFVHVQSKAHGEHAR